MATATLQVSGVAGGLIKRTQIVEAESIALSREGWQPLTGLCFTAQEAGIHTIEVMGLLEFGLDCDISDEVSIGLNCEREGVRSTFRASDERTRVIVRDLLPLSKGESVYALGCHQAGTETAKGRATLYCPRLTAVRGPDTEV